MVDRTIQSHPRNQGQRHIRHIDCLCNPSGIPVESFHLIAHHQAEAFVP